MSIDVSAAVERGKHDKDQRQRCLIESATQVFAENGYDAATTREVAERAGCSEGLIHRYFGGKHGLLLAILDDKAARTADVWSALMPPKETLAEEIEQMLVAPIDEFLRQRDFMRVCVSQSAIDPEVGKRIGNRVNGYKVAFMAERLAGHQAAGRVRPGIDVAAIALAISGLNIAQGFFAPVAFGMDRAQLDRCVLATAEVIIRGLSPTTE